MLADAAANANAIAKSYISHIGSPSNPGGAVQAQLLQPASRGTGSSLIKRAITYAIFALLGALFGAVIGAVIALAVDRSDRRLRARDEIANSIGVPVLASFPVGHPSNPGGWTRLLEDYKPGAMHALQLRKALQQLEMAAEVNFGRPGGKAVVIHCPVSFHRSRSPRPRSPASGLRRRPGDPHDTNCRSARCGGHGVAAHCLRRPAHIAKMAEETCVYSSPMETWRGP